MENTSSRNRLRELHGSGYEIADGQPNIIGWTIKDNNNHRVGVVDDLLFDEDQQKVRYIIANLKDNHFDLDKRKVIIPIGIAELHETNDDVIVPSVAAWQLRALPSYTGGISDYDEHEVYTVFSAQSGSSMQTSPSGYQKPQNFYEHSSFNYDNMYKRRSGMMKDKPMENQFRRREGIENFGSDSIGRGESDSRTMREPQMFAASHRNNDDHEDVNTREQRSQANERLIGKIKKMQSELDEIERDLRNNRGM